MASPLQGVKKKQSITHCVVIVRPDEFDGIGDTDIIEAVRERAVCDGRLDPEQPISLVRRNERIPAGETYLLDVNESNELQTASYRCYSTDDVLAGIDEQESA